MARLLLTGTRAPRATVPPHDPVPFDPPAWAPAGSTPPPPDAPGAAAPFGEGPPLPPPPSAPGAPPPRPTPAGGGDDPDGDRSRAGAIWVTGAGAFLLLAAAAVFVAVRWDTIGDEVKLAVLGALTGAALLAGRRLRPALPATGGVLFHLGALLIPLDVAAVAVHAELGWASTLVAVGGSAAAAWFVLERVESSAVLRWAAGGAVVVAAAGAAGLAGVPTALVLAAAAVLAQQLRAPTPAVAWAAVAGLGPLVVAVEDWALGADLARSLGFAPAAPGWTWLVSGAAAAVVLGREAQRRRTPILLVPAAVSLLLGVAGAWVTLDPSGGVDVIGAAGAFLVVELAAGLTRRDPFWRRPVGLAAVVTEVVAAAVLTYALLATTAWWLVGDPLPSRTRLELGAGAVLAAAAWLVGDLRRLHADARGRGAPLAIALGSGWAPATFGLVGSTLLGAGLLTGSSLAVGATAVGLAIVLVVTGRPGGHAVAAVLAVVAPLIAAVDTLATGHLDDWWPDDVAPATLAAIGAIGVGGALALAAAAVVRAHLPNPHENQPLAWLLATAALFPIGTAALVLLDPVDNRVTIGVAAAASWGVALVLDRARPGAPDRSTVADPAPPGRAARGIDGLGAVGRMGAVGTLVAAPLLGPESTFVLAACLSVALVADGVRLRAPAWLLGLSVTMPAGVAAGGAAAGLPVSEIGVALALLTPVAAGTQLLLGERRGWPFLGVVVASATAGLGLALDDPTSTWLVVLVLAGTGLAYATVHRSPSGGAAAGMAATVAVWGLLADGGVGVTDAYAAPVALALLVAGVVSRRTHGISSWVAYGPAIALLGSTALLERLLDGGGIHALVAGGVATAAIIAGGARRLAAPLLLGTVLLVGLTLHETLAVTRQVPTWGWLALGGATLVAAGIVMERRDTGPMESGRRLVDVVGTRFR